jgi:uncharacterized protein (DUF433 family)
MISIEMTPSDRIAIDPAILAGKPIVRGTRLSVEFVVGLLGDGWSEADVLRNYPNVTRHRRLPSLRGRDTARREGLPTQDRVRMRPIDQGADEH